MVHEHGSVELLLDVSASDLRAGDADLADAAERDDLERRGEDMDDALAGRAADRNDGRVGCGALVRDDADGGLAAKGSPGQRVQVSLRHGNCELILFAPWAVINHNPHASLEPGVPNPSLDLLAASVDDLDAEPGALPGVADRFAVPGLGLWVLKQKCSYCGGEVDERAFEAEGGVGEVGEEGRLGRHAERRAVLKVQKLLSTR